MAKITYSVVQKPIEERLIDAACIYWGVDRDYFISKREGVGGKEDSTVTYRKGIVYFSIKKNTIYSFKRMAEIFGFKSGPAVMRLVDNTEAQLRVIQQHCNDLKQIENLAAILDAKIITTEVNIISNIPEYGSI